MMLFIKYIIFLANDMKFYDSFIYSSIAGLSSSFLVNFIEVVKVRL